MSKYIFDIHGEIEGDYEIIGKYEEPTTKNDLTTEQNGKFLDELKGEIDKFYEREGNSVDCLNALDELKAFIDKYESESEEINNV